MAKRILLGKPANEDYGLYVSKTGADVVSASNVLTSSTNLMFDSRVGVGALDLKYHGQGLLGVPGNNLATATDLDTSDTFATITHNLGTADIMVQVYDITTEANIMCDIARTTDDFSTASTSVVSIDFGTAPPNDCRALITTLKGATAGTVAYT